MHFGQVIHLRDGIEEKNLLSQPERKSHLEEGVAADVVGYPLFIVVEDKNRVCLLNFAEMLADKVVLDFGGDALLIILRMNIALGVHELDALWHEHRVPRLLQRLLNASHLPMELHAAANRDGHGRDIVNDVRTIIQNYSGYIHIPDLQPQLATYPTV